MNAYKYSHFAVNTWPACFSEADIVRAQKLANRQKRFYNNKCARQPTKVEFKGKVYPFVCSTSDFLEIDSIKKDLKNTHGYKGVIVRYLMGGIHNGERVPAKALFYAY